MVRKPFQVKIQTTPSSCFIVGALLCLVHHLFIFLYDFLRVYDADVSFLFFADSICPCLKKRYHNCLERVKGYIETVTNFNELISPQSLFLQFLCLEPSSHVQKNIEIVKKSKYIDFVSIRLPLDVLDNYCLCISFMCIFFIIILITTSVFNVLTGHSVCYAGVFCQQQNRIDFIFLGTGIVVKSKQGLKQELVPKCKDQKCIFATKKKTARLLVDIYSILLFKVETLLKNGLPLFGIFIFWFKNAPTLLCLSRDKTKEQSSKNTTLTSTKILPKKQHHSLIGFQITLSTYKF